MDLRDDVCGLIRLLQKGKSLTLACCSGPMENGHRPCDAPEWLPLTQRCARHMRAMADGWILDVKPTRVDGTKDLTSETVELERTQYRPCSSNE